jgi:hypothetical protein
MIKEYTCPVCDGSVFVCDDDKEAVCNDCLTRHRVDRDADYVYGNFVDMTSLTPIES